MQLKRTAVVSAGVLVVGAAVLAQSGTAQNSRIAADEGGLAVSPFGVDHAATIGSTDSMTVTNRSKQALDIAVAPRPWTQSSSGAVSPNRRSTLGAVKVSATDFTLAPGESRKVDVTLGATASGGSLFGALEVVGLPTDIASRKGVVTGYRLVGALRYHAAAKTYKLVAGTPKVASDKTIVLPLRSQGNTNEAVSGTVRVKGALGTKNGSVKATRILPGKQVNIALASGKTLKAGSYTATVTLKQGTLRTTVTKKLRVK
ncbi:hypothetical protein OJ997_28090 [Solirubrobacter phytolaccae]|uniref:Uncharacterized protein n=1 Tax=Solirubrobacter phytolaccae TaxID=1404360 RepID=A0A9X3SIE1_9ACTN|nr:hypothetical protein [Solirubrobacter phytolaccae]MDA0184202.1 hypothetical protein [Solirubrobacter phytolaccae]